VILFKLFFRKNSGFCQDFDIMWNVLNPNSMKKIFALLALGAVFVSGCGKVVEENVSEDVTVVSENMEVVKTDAILSVYENSEMGIKFTYPPSEDVSFVQETELDTGKKMSVTVAGVSFVMTSEDFAEGVSEGCCYYYKGAGVDLSLSDEELLTALTETLGSVKNVKRIKVDDRDALRFVREVTYAETQEVVTVLIPNPETGFANLMISGPAEGEDMTTFNEILDSLTFMARG